MEFGLLGPIQVLDEQRVVSVPGGRVRALLAVLLLRANQVTTAQQLGDYLRDRTRRPLRPSAVQTYVGRLRQALGREAGARLVRTTPSGYVLALDPDQLDLTRFRRLVKAASLTDEPAAQAALLTEAMTLWRGQPMADLAVESMLHAELLELLEERMHALERLMDARLVLGQHAEIVPELTRLCHEHPLREQFWAQYMLALYRCGRQAEALQAFREISRQLADDLGIDPGVRLRRLHQEILTAQGAGVRTWWPQCQLPAALGDFVGRHAEIQRLQTLLGSRDTVPIVAVCGPLRVGKTALAVRVAHELRPVFPDGQWYARMTEAGGRPRNPADVLAELLTAGGTPPSAVPCGLEQRAAMLRAVLADRQVLLLLDDAHSAEQVRPLLPGTGGNAVLITSSHDLTGLIASHGGHKVTLGMLDPAEARTLLVGMLGAPRVDAEPAAVADLLRLCGRSPSTLRTAAAELMTRPGKAIAGYVATIPRNTAALVALG